eukprot:356645-Chlamydomonas_euryale.AAC.1
MLSRDAGCAPSRNCRRGAAPAIGAPPQAASPAHAAAPRVPPGLRPPPPPPPGLTPRWLAVPDAARRAAAWRRPQSRPRPGRPLAPSALPGAPRASAGAPQAPPGQRSRRRASAAGSTRWRRHPHPMSCLSQQLRERLRPARRR